MVYKRKSKTVQSVMSPDFYYELEKLRIDLEMSMSSLIALLVLVGIEEVRKLSDMKKQDRLVYIAGVLKREKDLQEGALQEL